MNWMQSIDRYLTTPPNDGFNDWAEATIEALSNSFFDANEDWIMDSKQFNDWLNKLSDGGHSPKSAAMVIERTFSICKKQTT